MFMYQLRYMDGLLEPFIEDLNTNHLPLVSHATRGPVNCVDAIRHDLLSRNPANEHFLVNIFEGQAAVFV